MRNLRSLALTLTAVLALVLVFKAPVPLESQGFTDRTGIATQAAIACATTATLAVRANDSRNYLFLQNSSDTDILVTVGTSAATTGNATGFRLIAAATSPHSVREWVQKVPVGYLSCAHFGVVGGSTKTLQVIEGQR